MLSWKPDTHTHTYINTIIIYKLFLLYYLLNSFITAEHNMDGIFLKSVSFCHLYFVNANIVVDSAHTHLLSIVVFSLFIILHCFSLHVCLFGRTHASVNYFTIIIFYIEHSRTHASLRFVLSCILLYWMYTHFVDSTHRRSYSLFYFCV